MTGDVGCAEHLPTDAAGDLALVSDHVGTESVFGGESRGTGRYLTFKRSFGGMHMLHMAAQVVWPGKAFPTHRTNIGLVDSPIMRANMVGHPILPLKALLADWALEGLLVRMGQLVTIQVVDVTEGFATHLAAVVFLDRFGGFLGDILLRHVAHYRRRHDACA